MENGEKYLEDILFDLPPIDDFESTGDQETVKDYENDYIKIKNINKLIDDINGEKDSARHEELLENYRLYNVSEFLSSYKSEGVETLPDLEKYLTEKHEQHIKETGKKSSEQIDEKKKKEEEEKAKAELEKLQKQEDERRALNAKLKELRAKRDAILLQLKTIPRELSEDEKESLKASLKAKLDPILAEINEIKTKLKEMPTIKKIQAEKRKYKPIKNVKKISGELKSPDDKVEKLREDAREKERAAEMVTPSAEVASPHVPPAYTYNVASQATASHNQATPVIASRANAPAPAFSLSEYNNKFIKDTIEEYEKHSRVRGARGTSFTYIEPVIGKDGKIVDCKFISEDLTKTKYSFSTFANNPLRAYKKALKEKLKILQKAELLGAKDKLAYSTYKKKLIQDFKNSLDNKQYDLCAAKMLAIRTAITPDELKTVLTKNEYPLDNYKVNGITLNDDGRSLKFNPGFHKTVADLYPDRKDATPPVKVLRIPRATRNKSMPKPKKLKKSHESGDLDK